MPVYGRAGGGVASGNWVANEGVRRAGVRGEQLAARVLEDWAARTGAAVIHDVLVPHPKFTFNVDHVCIFGTQVLLIDAKLWRPGFFWTFGGHSRRGFESFPYADKQTMALAVECFGRTLAWAKPRFDLPIVAVFPTDTSKPLRTWALRVPGARVVQGPDLARKLPRHVAAPNGRVVEAFLRHAVS